MDDTGKNFIECDVIVQGSFWAGVEINTRGGGQAAYMAYKMAASPMIEMIGGKISEELENM